MPRKENRPAGRGRGEIVLSAGAYVSPGNLDVFRSLTCGVVRPLGIQFVAGLPVGRRLQGHFSDALVHSQRIGWLAFPPIGATLWGNDGYRFDEIQAGRWF